MAIRRDITAADGVYTGTDTHLNFTIYIPGTTEAQITAGTATKQNITGYTFAFELRYNRDSAPALTKTSGAGIAITNAANGALSITIDRADWAAFDGGSYWHQLARTNTGNYTVETDGSFVLQRGIRA